jgi:peptidyl-prolyl cis-trans isomerase SurA
MPKRMGTIALTAVLAMVVVAAGCGRGRAPAPDVWAVVNGQEIHRAEVEKYYKNRVSAQGHVQSQEEALSLMLNILDELINNDILIQRAKKLGLEATDGEVEDKFTEYKSPYTDQEFQRQLKDRGITVDDLKQQIRDQLSVQKLVDREVLSKISITDQDVGDFYTRYRAQFNVPEAQYRIEEIVVTPHKDAEVRNRKNDDATSDIEARRKCAALEQQLRNGSDFSQLAMDYSEDPVTAPSGGDLGFIPESALSQSNPILKKIVLSMTVGEVSPVIRLADSYRILRLVAKEMPGQRQLSDPQVQQSIRDTLRNRKEQLLRSAYIATARDQAKVTNYLALQVMESNGKLPEIVKPGAPATVPSPVPSPLPPTQ